VLDKDPENELATRERGVALMHLGKFEDAVPWLEKTLELAPNDFLAWRNLAETHVRAGNPVAALAVVRDYEGSMPPTPEVRAFQAVSHGIAFEAAGNREKAIAKARQAVAEARYFAFSHWFLGSMLRKAGRQDEAVDALRRSIALDPSADAHADLGLALASDDPEAALKHLREAVRLVPTNADHQASLARFHLRHRADPDRAFAAAREALRHNGSHAMAWNVLIGSYWMRGDIANFERYARQAHQLNPSAPEALLHMANLHAHRGDVAAALGFAQRALAQGAPPEAHATAGILLARMGRNTEAAAAMQRCAAKRPPKGTDNAYYPGFRESIPALQAGPRLVGLRREFETLKRKDRVVARHVLWAWKLAPLLAPVRDPIPLAKLPDAQRDGWVPFWNDVDAFLAEGF
jgi:tetratricopeptide (TPR) repeat protein